MEKRTIKWGIMGPGRISSLFAKDLAFAEGAELTAVGSSSLERAEKFAQEFGAKRAYGSYQELVQDPDLDIIYIGTLHPMHKENVLTCLQAGKAVLCEKPFTLNARDTEELVRAAREKNLFLMEAMWTRFLPPIVKVREWLNEGRIGEVRLLKADFGFDGAWQPEGRLFNKALGGGALLDVGIYPVSLASMVFGEQPLSIKSSVQIGETGVDEQFSALFEYEGGRVASMNSAVRMNLTDDAYLYGTKGYIHMPNFWFGPSASLYVQGEEPVHFTDNRQSRGYVFEAEEAMACLREGRTESRIITLHESIEIMKTMDVIRSQWNLRYPTE